jgi:hypothetical protein
VTFSFANIKDVYKKQILHFPSFYFAKGWFAKFLPSKNLANNILLYKV